MATVGEGLKANIRIGGTIDASWRNGVGQIKEGLLGITKETTALKNRQAKLAQQMKKAVLEGKDITKLRSEYETLGKKIGDATKEQGRLNSQLKKAETLSKWMSRGKGMAKFTAGGLLATGGLLAAGATAAVRINSETAEQDAKARSYGVELSTFQAWEGMAKRLGLNGENVGDLPEEMAHKIGEYKETGKMGAVEDAFTALGLKASDMNGLSNQEQFEKIMDIAARMPDFQKASFVVDDLMGGEASKFLQLMRQTGKTWKELEDEQKKYILTTREGADGATEGSRALDNLMTVFGSGIANVAGLLGKEMAPSVTNIADQLADWFRDGGVNKIKDFITNDAIPAVLDFADGVWFITKLIWATAKKLEWLLPDNEGDQRGVLKRLGESGLTSARAQAAATGQTEWFEQTIRDNPDLEKNVKESWESTRGRFGFDSDDDAFNKSVDVYVTKDDEQQRSDLTKEIREWFHGRDEVGRGVYANQQISAPSTSPLAALAYTPGNEGGVTVKSDPKITATFYITQQPGEDGEALGKRVNDDMSSVYTRYADQVW